MIRSTFRGLTLGIAAIVGVATAAAAQTPADGSGLLLGPLTLRPSIVLRDAGVDSNIFNVRGEDTEDHTATIAGRTEARLRVGTVQIDGMGSGEYLYFERHTQERALNRAVSVRVQPQFIRLRPFVAGAYRRARDRANTELDIRAPRTEHEHGAGLEAQVSSRATLEVTVRRSYWQFDEGESFRGVDLATRLNRESDTGRVAFRYELSALTTFTAATVLVRERFTSSPDRNADTLQAEAGLLFAPDAIIRGRAVAGFRTLRPRGDLPVPSRGPTAGVELSYTLLDRTVFSGRLLRESAVSIESNPFYISTLAAIEVTHHLFGPVDLVGRAGRERLEYEPVPARSLLGHLDRVATAGGGIALRLGPRVRITGMYEDIRRRSNLLDDRDYDRRRAYTTVTYGF